MRALRAMATLTAAAARSAATPLRPRPAISLLEDTPPSADGGRSASPALAAAANGPAGENQPQGPTPLAARTKTFRDPNALAAEREAARRVEAPAAGKRKARRAASSDEPEARRAKADKADGAGKKKSEQARIVGAKVTKPSVGPAPKKQPAGAKGALQNSNERARDTEPLGIAAAAGRRRSWTPAEDSFCVVDDKSTSPAAGGECTQVSPGTARARSLVGALRETFGFDGALAPAAECAQPAAPTRRRKLAQPSVAGKEAAGTKVSPVKKKARTITEKATEHFRSLAAHGRDGDDASRDQPDLSAKASSSRRKSPAKKAQDSDERLLRPDEALDVWNQQDLVFGTCSQLVREDSPGTIRNIQRALLESVGEETASASADDSLFASPASTSLTRASTKSLWTAAARNQDGSLLDAEFIDLTRSSSALNLAATPKLMQASNGAHAETARELDVEPSTKNATLDLETGVDQASEGTASAVTPGEDSQPTGPLHEMPDYNSWGDTELKMAIEGYGFKPMKTRKPMIKKLEKCWLAQHPQQSALNSATVLTEVEAGVRRGKSKAGRAAQPPSSPVRASGVHLEVADAQASGKARDVDRSHIYSKIREAVVSCPPTHDAKNLTWHEKILLYDPIVLEDLTIWLNSEGLGRAGVDEEVAPSLVRDWCESQSICCLWRINVRGVERNR